MTTAAATNNTHSPLCRNLVWKTDAGQWGEDIIVKGVWTFNGETMIESRPGKFWPIEIIRLGSAKMEKAPNGESGYPVVIDFGQDGRELGWLTDQDF